MKINLKKKRNANIQDSVPDIRVFYSFSTDLFGIQKEFDEPFFRVKNTLGSVSKPNRAILSSVVGQGLSARRHKANCFRASNLASTN